MARKITCQVFFFFLKKEFLAVPFQMVQYNKPSGVWVIAIKPLKFSKCNVANVSITPIRSHGWHYNLVPSLAILVFSDTLTFNKQKYEPNIVLDYLCNES